MESKRFSILIAAVFIAVFGMMTFSKFQNFKKSRAQVRALQNRLAPISSEQKLAALPASKSIADAEPEQVEEKVVIKKKKVKRIQVVEIQDDHDEPSVPVTQAQAVPQKKAVTLEDATETLENLNSAKDAVESLMDF